MSDAGTPGTPGVPVGFFESVRVPEHVEEPGLDTELEERQVYVL